jgi:hypothetical protein
MNEATIITMARTAAITAMSEFLRELCGDTSFHALPEEQQVALVAAVHKEIARVAS